MKKIVFLMLLSLVVVLSLVYNRNINSQIKVEQALNQEVDQVLDSAVAPIVDSAVAPENKIFRYSGHEFTYSQDEIMETAFFNLEILKIEIARNYREHIPIDKSAKFLVLEIFLNNIGEKDVPFTYGDFPVFLSEAEDDTPYLPLEVFLYEQLPDTFLLAANESITGSLIYEIPKSTHEFYLIYKEIYEDGFLGNTHTLFIIS